MKSEIKITADGSSTLFVPDLNEYYHSMYGAVQESEYVFLQMGLESFKHKNITLFEFGFGTGLNALLTFLKSDEYSYIEYHTMELYPLKWQVIEKLDFPELVRRIEKGKAIGRTLILKVKFENFEQITRSKSQPESFTFPSIHKTAVDLASAIDYKNKGVRLLGLTLSNLENPEETDAQQLEINFNN
ncbi:DNA polymerase IV [subsurface metagenome]